MTSSNTRVSVKTSIEEITGKTLEFYQLDAKDAKSVSNSIGHIDGVIHFATLKSIGESIEKPMEYYTENLESILSIIQVTNEKNAKSCTFKNSAMGTRLRKLAGEGSRRRPTTLS